MGHSRLTSLRRESAVAPAADEFALDLKRREGPITAVRLALSHVRCTLNCGRNWVGTAILYAFDLIEHDGDDLRHLPFSTAKPHLPRRANRARPIRTIRRFFAEEEGGRQRPGQVSCLPRNTRPTAVLSLAGDKNRGCNLPPLHGDCRGGSAARRGRIS